MDEAFPFPQATAATHGWRRCWLGTRGYWQCQGLGIVLPSILGLFFGLYSRHLIADIFSLTYGVREALLGQLSALLATLLLTHVFRLGILWLRFRHWRARFLIPSLLLWCACAGAAQLGATGLLNRLVLGKNYFAGEMQPNMDKLTKRMEKLTGPLPAPPPPERSPPPAVMLVANWLGASCLFCLWGSLYFGINYHRHNEARKREHERLLAATRDTELHSLRTQLNPHFFFNSLNTLRALIPRESERPRAAVTLLADLMRASLTLGRQNTVAFANEWETVNNYLSLEQLRHESRLRLRRTIRAEVLPLAFPPLALQTLVENTVNYGIARREEGGEIALGAEVTEGMLRVSVTNPGTLATTSESTGLGLKNVRARLALLFGPAAILTLAQTGPDLVTAEIVLPAIWQATPTGPTPLST